MRAAHTSGAVGGNAAATDADASAHVQQQHTTLSHCWYARLTRTCQTKHLSACTGIKQCTGCKLRLTQH